MGRLTLPDDIIRRMISHVREVLPAEAVGLLAGRSSGLVGLVLPLSNIADSSRRAFLADPFGQYSALRRVREEGLELLAIYHSHPDGGEDPSPEDLQYAQAWPCVHVIIVFDSKRDAVERLRAFRCLPSGSIENVALEM